MDTKSHICGNCENANSPSVCAACVNYNLNEKYKLLNALKHHRDSLHKRLDEKLKANSQAVHQQRSILTSAKTIDQLKEILRLKENQLCEEKSELEAKTKELNTKLNSLAEASAVLKENKTKQLKLHSELICTKNSVLTGLQAELLQNQSVAIKQVCKIFSLDRVHKRNDGRNRDERSGRDYWYDQICNVSLPRGLNPYSVTPRELAVSMGYMVQLLNLVARYLYAPLLLESGFAGSCSRVWQRSSYADSRRKRGYSLFFPSQNNCIRYASKGCSSSVLDVASVLNFDLKKVMGEDVQKGIHLLKKAVACVTTYYFNLFSIPLPTDISTFEAFQKILKFISSIDKDAATFIEETKLRCSRRQGVLLESSDPGIALRRLQESQVSKDQLSLVVGRGDGPSWFTSTNLLYNNETPDLRRSKDDGWEVVEHPQLPPEYSKENVEPR